MNEIEKFNNEKKENIKKIGENKNLKKSGINFILDTAPYQYSYNFSWLGRPIIQFPQDMIAMQEIIWNIKPDLIIETGIAHGGSLIFYASILELIGGDRIILGIDIDIREHNRIEIEKHPMYKKIRLIQGSSIDENIFNQVKEYTKNKNNIMVVLDSNHTHDHVLKELQLYSSLVTKGNYLVVFDTVVEDLPDSLYPNRPWGKGNNPKTAVREFLKNNDDFVIDREIENKLLITVAPDGYLKRVK